MPQRKKGRRRALAPGVRWAGSVYRLEIRDRRLRGQRLDISLDVRNEDDAETANAIAAAVRTLIDRGERGALAALRKRELRPADVLRAVREGDFSALRAASGRMTLEAALDATLETVDATREPGTYGEYVKVARLLRAHFGGDANLTDITTTAAADFLRSPKDTLDRDTWAPATQGRYAQMAGRVWADADARLRDEARADGRTHVPLPNPWRAVDLPRVRPTRHAFLIHSEWLALLRANQGLPVAAALALMCRAGLRAGEVLSLRTDLDVDMDGARVRIQSRKGAGEWRPKSDRGQRDIPMADDLRIVLDQHIADGYAGGRSFLRLPHVDQPPSYHTLRRWIKLAYQRAGIRYGTKGDALTGHSLRHTFGSWLAMEDVQIIKIAALMGITVRVATEHYLHLVPGDDAEAIRRTVRRLEKEGE